MLDKKRENIFVVGHILFNGVVMERELRMSRVNFSKLAELVCPLVTVYA